MDAATEPKEKVFYESSSGDLVTDTRLRFGSNTLFLRDVTGTSIAIVPTHPISSFLMKSFAWASCGCGFVGRFRDLHAILLLLPFTIGGACLTLRNRIQLLGQVYVHTPNGRVCLTVCDVILPYEPFLRVLFNWFGIQLQSHLRLTEELQTIQKAIRSAMAATKS